MVSEVGEGRWPTRRTFSPGACNPLRGTGGASEHAPDKRFRSRLLLLLPQLGDIPQTQGARADHRALQPALRSLLCIGDPGRAWHEPCRDRVSAPAPASRIAGTTA